MRKTVIFSICLLVSACSHSPVPESKTDTGATSKTVRISPDYIATGQSAGLRVFKYGQHTLIEAQGSTGKAWGLTGDTITFDKVGNYLVSEKVLDDFYIRHNGQTVHIELVRPEPVIAEPAPLPEPVKVEVVKVKSFPELEAYSRDQLGQYQKMLDDLAAIKSTTGADLFHAQVKQNALKEKLEQHSPVTFISFGFAKTLFEPDTALDKVLFPAAMDASEIHLRGRTDSVRASKADVWIAEQRANNVKSYLVENGVDPKIIKVSHLPEGDFLLPPQAETSKAVNRRVEIEVKP